MSNTSTPPTLADGEVLLDRVKDMILRHVVIRDEAATIVALWLLWTYVSTHGYFQPRLAIISPEPRCGKSTLLRLLGLLCRDGRVFSNISTAALFRAIAKTKPTMLIDEADTFMRAREEMSNILNAGFEKGQTVARCAPNTNELEEFEVSGPVAIAAIGADTLTSALLDRSVLIEMMRKPHNLKLEPLRVDRPQLAHALAEELAHWCAAYADAYADAPEPPYPDLGSDRAVDKYRPLLTLAALIGTRWYQAAFDAAIQLEASSAQEAHDSSGTRLLSDIRDIISQRPGNSVSSEDLLHELLQIEDAPWAEAGHNGRAMSKHQLARQLGRFRIKSLSIRTGKYTPRGYRFADFDDAFRVYLPANRNIETQK